MSMPESGKILAWLVAASLAAIWIIGSTGGSKPTYIALGSDSEVSPLAEPTPAPTPYFRFPVVPHTVVSGYFDHTQTGSSSGEDFQVQFFDARYSPDALSGFYFHCPGIGDGNFWVGCAVPGKTSEQSCPNDQELWYDNHKGVDFEYFSD